MKKTTYFFSLLAITSMLFAGSSCNDSPDPIPAPPLPDGAFKITLSNITYSSVKILVEPEDKTQTYYSHILAKKDFAKNWNSSVSALMIDYIAFLCEEHGISKQEVVAEMMTKGNYEWDYTRLAPATEYVIFAVGLNADGSLTTNPVMKEFTSAALPPVVPVECTFDIRVSNIAATRAQIDITPSNKTTPYFFDIVPVALYPSGDATAFLSEFVQTTIYSVMDQNGMSFEESVAAITSMNGTGMNLTPGTLKPTTQYFVVAFGIDAYGRPTTIPAKQEFSTLAVIPSSNTFTIGAIDATATSAAATITPTNDDPYYANIFLKAELAGRTDEEILATIQSQGIIQATNTGVYMLDAADRLFSGTEYEILVFGYNEGVTTAITRKSFTTLASGDPALCTFEFDIANEGSNAIMGVYPSDPSVFYIFDLVLKSEYTTDSAFTAGIESELKTISQDTKTPMQTLMLDLCARGPAEATIPVKSQQKYYAVIFALNIDGTAAGTVYKEDYTAKEQIVSTATAEVKVLKYYNGLELFKFDPVKYAGGAENMAYIVTTVTHSADAVHWYAAIYGDDVTASTDNSIIKNLVELGGDKDKDHLEISWAYFFDVKYYGRDGIPNTLCAVAVDAEGNYGPVFKTLFNPVTTGTSPISEITGVQPAVITGQAPLLFKEEQPTASQSHLVRLTRPSESGNSTHLMFAAPVAKTQIVSAQATPVASLQKIEGLQNTGTPSRMFGHGKTLRMQ